MSYVTVTNAIRLPVIINDRPHVLKFSFGSLDQNTIAQKQTIIKFQTKYKHVQIRSSKSRIERIMEMNARVVLRNLPQGRSLRVNASRRIQQHVQQQQQQAYEPSQINTGQTQEADVQDASRPKSISLAHLNECGWNTDNNELRINLVNGLKKDIISKCGKMD